MAGYFQLRKKVMAHSPSISKPRGLPILRRKEYKVTTSEKFHRWMQNSLNQGETKEFADRKRANLSPPPYCQGCRGLSTQVCKAQQGALCSAVGVESLRSISRVRVDQSWKKAITVYIETTKLSTYKWHCCFNSGFFPLFAVTYVHKWGLFSMWTIKTK